MRDAFRAATRMRFIDICYGLIVANVHHTLAFFSFSLFPSIICGYYVPFRLPLELARDGNYSTSKPMLLFIQGRGINRKLTKILSIVIVIIIVNFQVLIIKLKL